ADDEGGPREVPRRRKKLPDHRRGNESAAGHGRNVGHAGPQKRRRAAPRRRKVRMNRHDVLEKEIVWDESGHLSEVAKSALADGQDAILPPDALRHFSLCQLCVQSVGEAALLSAQLSAALRAERPERAAQRSLPWIPIAAALTIAAFSTIPTLSMVRPWLAVMGSFVRHVLRILGHAVVAVAAHGFAPTFYLASTCVLLAMGFAVARLVPRMSAQAVRGKGFSS